MALEMSLFARELAKERIRAEHPEWMHSRVALELIRLALLPAPMPAGMTSSEVFRRITTVAYMLSGSFASGYHGAPRST
jgi:hypothetical protein